MFHAPTLRRLGLCEILVKRIFILCARVKSGVRWFEFFEFLKKMGENGEIVRFLWYFMVFWKRTYGELMSGLGTSLILLWKVFTVLFKVIARNFRNIPNSLALRNFWKFQKIHVKDRNKIVFHAPTLRRLGLCEILVKRIFILCARVKSSVRWFIFFQNCCSFF